MKREDVGCPLCGARDSVPWGDEGGWRAVRCRECALVYVSPRPIAAEISEAAKLGQHAIEDGVLDVVGSFSQKKVKGFVVRLGELWPVAPPWRAAAMSWLDIGAGFGELVHAVSELYARRAASGVAGDELGASRILGLEPCAPKVARANALSLPVEARTLESLAGTRWDVVSLINVFSHLPDPLGFLEEVRGLVRPGGELLLVTGNGAEIERADYPQALSLPDHIVFGGEPQLRRLLERAGFSVERVARFATAMPRPAWEARAEALAATLLRRRVGYSGTPFRSLWIRARRTG